MKQVKRFLILGVFALISLTSSMDVFLMVDIGGFTVRLAILLMMGLIGWQMLSTWRSKRLFLLPGIGWLVALFYLNLIFALNSSLLVRSMGYAVWMGVFICWVVAVMQLSRKENWQGEERSFSPFSWLFTIYMLSFLPALLLGWLQWALPSLQWMNEGLWRTQGLLPLFGDHGIQRANGWNFEPSFYATYLIVLPPLLWVWFRRSQGWMRTLTGGNFLFSVVMVVLSTSRMGWVALAVALAGIALVEGWLWVKKRFSLEKVLKKILVPALLVGLVAVVGALLVLPWQEGLERALKHSYGERMTGVQNTFEVLFRHPLFSVSLGGIAPDIAISRGNIVPQGNQDVQLFEGMSVFLEFLGGLGIIGGFIVAGLLTAFGLLVSRRFQRLDPSQRPWLAALVFGMVLQMFLLMFNQNILRAYVWHHFAIVIGFLAYTEGKQDNEASLAPHKVPQYFARVGLSLLVAFCVATVGILVFTFQPLRMDVTGGAVNFKRLPALKWGILWYNTGRDFGGDRMSLAFTNTSAYFSFQQDVPISKTLFQPTDKDVLWQRYSELLPQPNLPHHIGPAFALLVQTLREKDPRYLQSSQGLVAGLNALLQNEAFWQAHGATIRLSPLTYAYRKTKDSPDFDPIRYHRLLLEDMSIWIPRNPEGHRRSPWIFDLAIAEPSSQDPVADMEIESLTLFTTLGPVTIRPWQPQPSLVKSTYTRHIHFMYDWGVHRLQVQMRLYRWWGTLIIGALALVAGFVTWRLSGRMKKG